MFFSLTLFEAASNEKKDNYIKIDFRLNTKNPDSKNYFNWKTSSTNLKDSFDAVSGASLYHSTKEFRTVSYDKSGKNILTPQGLKGLLLYAVSSYETLKKDNLSIESKGRQLKISFNHRGNFYKIITDENGVMNIPESFFIIDQSSEVSNEEVQSKLIEDTVSENSEELYTGKLFTKLDKNGILKINGKLVLQSKAFPESPQTPAEQSKKLQNKSLFKNNLK
ncbi:hypothetical protein [Treponema sp.]|uniref:hypothetical protein n=1 Tax=Treponema sp. TaxID=166 RepID=UPI00388DBE5D